MAEAKPPEKEIEEMKRAVQQAAQTPPPEAQKLGKLLNNLILAAQEIAYELVTTDCLKINECPIAQKSKELVKALKDLHTLMKEIGTRR